jgi:predicted porin
MKKTLVAIAALTAVSAFAQSSVTMDGYIDRGYTTTNNTNNAKDFKGLGSNAGTTTIGIKGVEDLGGGMKVGFSVNTDWADVGGLTQDADTTKVAYVAGSTTAFFGAATPTQAGTFANSQSFIELIDAKIGTLRLGSPNNDTLTNATSVASPAFSTGIGSAYSSSWSVHNGMGTGVTGAGGLVSLTALASSNVGGAGARGIRQANTIKYISPNFSGVQFSYSNAQANSNSGTSTIDTVGVTEAALRYTNGPLDVMYTSLEYKVGSGTAPANGGLTLGTSSKQDLLGASYQVLPALKLHAGFGKSTASATTIADSKSTQYGVTYVVGKFDVLAQVAKVDDNSSSNVDRKMTGLGVNYNFSKTARAYVRYDNLKMNEAYASTDGNSIKRTAIGISKSF